MDPKTVDKTNCYTVVISVDVQSLRDDDISRVRLRYVKYFDVSCKSGIAPFILYVRDNYFPKLLIERENLYGSIISFPEVHVYEPGMTPENTDEPVKIMPDYMYETFPDANVSASLE